MLRFSVAFAAILTIGLTPLAGRADVVPLAIEDGACELIAETGRPSDHFYLVVGSLADAGRTTRISVRTEATAAPARLAVDRTTAPALWRELMLEQATRQEKARLLRKPVALGPTLPPAKTRLFHVFVKERDLENPSHYAAVTADLRALGRHCQVYVDRAAGEAGLAILTADILCTFDDEVFPWANRHLGNVQDVDRDGRFTILLTPLLGALQDGTVSVDGFVRGSDFNLDLAAPFSNGCDMMYLNSRLKPGPHLHTLLAHEYAHAVTYCEHVQENYLPGTTRQDEQGWLNEGLSHLVEEQVGYGWSNLDYRIDAYLACPERYPLVVPDYYHSGLWRTAGTRGAAFLFLRSCRERHGLGLLTRLCRSNLAGVPNLEAATREHFEELFRHWAVTMLQDGGAWTRKAKLGRLCVGPRFHDMSARGECDDFSLVGTGLLYVRVHSPEAARTRIMVRGEPDTKLQVTLVRPGPEQPWLQLRCAPAQTPGHVQLFLTAHGADMRIEAAAWDQPQNSHNAGAWGLAGAELKAGKMRTWEIAPAGAGPHVDPVFRVLARDKSGNDLAAWAVLRHNSSGGGDGL